MASNVSKLLPTVSNVIAALVGAVQQYHTDFPPESPAWSGSPVSFVALAFVSSHVPELPARLVQAAKASFAGCACALAIASSSQTATPNPILLIDFPLTFSQQPRVSSSQT